MASWRFAELSSATSTCPYHRTSAIMSAFNISSAPPPRTTRGRLSLSAFIPPSKLLRRFSSPATSNFSTSLRRSERNEQSRATRVARESAPSPATIYAESQDASFWRPGQDSAVAAVVHRTGQAGTAREQIVEEPEHIEHSAGEYADRFFESTSAGHARGSPRRPVSDTETVLQTPTIGRLAAEQTVSDSLPSYAPTQHHVQAHIHPQSAPTSPTSIRSQQVWLCSPPPKQTLTPVSPVSTCGIASCNHTCAPPSTSMSTRSPSSWPLGSIADLSHQVKDELATAHDAQVEAGPPRRCRPIATRAMSTGRLASGFEEDGRIICISVHSDRVLAKAHELSDGEVGKGSRCPTSWRDAALRRTISEQGAGNATRQRAGRRADLGGRTSAELSRAVVSGKRGAYQANEDAKRSRASLRGILGL